MRTNLQRIKVVCENGSVVLPMGKTASEWSDLSQINDVGEKSENSTKLCDTPRKIYM